MIDGRSCRAQLAEVSTYLIGARDTLTLEDVNVCDKGTDGVHWYGNGYGHNCYGSSDVQA